MAPSVSYSFGSEPCCLVFRQAVIVIMDRDLVTVDQIVVGAMAVICQVEYIHGPTAASSLSFPLMRERQSE